jgi:hypothetical protein
MMVVGVDFEVRVGEDGFDMGTRERWRVSTKMSFLTLFGSMSLKFLKLNRYVALWMKKWRRFFSWLPGKMRVAPG